MPEFAIVIFNFNFNNVTPQSDQTNRSVGSWKLYWSGFNSSWWKIIKIRYGIVQKGILSQRGVTSNVLEWFFIPTWDLSSAGVERSLTGTAINPFKILYRLVRLKFFLLDCKSVQPRSSIIYLELLHLIYAGSCLLRNVQQLFEFCSIYQYHLACTDPIQDKGIPKLTEPLKNMQSLLI